DTIYQLLKFFKSSENIFILNGFAGSGKTYAVDAALYFLSEDVLVFNNLFQESTNLDDVLLSLFNDFSIYHNEKIIELPKAETSVFSDKINTYIKYCNAPMLFIFDSFEINMKSKDAQKDILDFINFLSHFEKVKIIISSRSFRQSSLLSEESSVTATLKSLTKEELYDYLHIKNISGGHYEIEELFKVSRGHFLLIELSVMIMQLLNISVTVFSTEYKKSAKNFFEFLISKILSVSSEKFMKLLIFLAIIRHYVSLDFLFNQNLADEESIAFLMQKYLLSEKNGKYYIKDYIKTEIIKLPNVDTKINVHKYLLELYESELPLKPFERELFLSRMTMRQEIAYHSKKIDNFMQEREKAGKGKLSESFSFNYLSYSKNSGYEDKMNRKKQTQKKYIQNLTQKLGEKKRRFELSKEDSLILNSIKPVDNLTKELHDISSPVEHIEFNNEINIEDKVPDSLDAYLEIAQNYEEAYNFSSAILYYKKALTYTNDESFNTKEPVIYTKLAICYKKIQDTDEAIRLYEKVYSLYLENLPEKSNVILLSIAQIYSEAYNFDKAQETYKRILFSQAGCPSEMKIRVYLDLSELYDNNLDTASAMKYCSAALGEAEKISDIKLLTECYFKNALLNDDNNNTDMALKYYLRCVQISNDAAQNEFLSSAYSNLAEISRENDNISAAKMYYELAIEADKLMNNYEGLYFSYTKLAGIYKTEDSQKTYEILMKALSAAKRFDDVSYAAAVYFEIGEYYLDTEDYKKALKSFILSQNLSSKQNSGSTSDKINKQINKIKMRLGDMEFSKILSEIKKKK
ncbi:MAG: hypothetical protein LUG16_01750, partial [Candidatus Gastranaerophilales bacterium]|nr:hypothetical protein [Candidatus Gastranaerophilales bacterium]